MMQWLPSMWASITWRTRDTRSLTLRQARSSTTRSMVYAIARLLRMMARVYGTPESKSTSAGIPRSPMAKTANTREWKSLFNQPLILWLMTLGEEPTARSILWITTTIILSRTLRMLLQAILSLTLSRTMGATMLAAIMTDRVGSISASSTIFRIPADTGMVTMRTP